MLDEDTERSIIQIGESSRDLTTAGRPRDDRFPGQPRLIDSYANELFRLWGIGQKDKNNGVLILNVVRDRMIRIEVGYGLKAR